MSDSLILTIVTLVITMTINIFQLMKNRFNNLKNELVFSTSFLSVLFFIQLSPFRLVFSPILKSINPIVILIIDIVFVFPNIWLAIYSLLNYVLFNTNSNKIRIRLNSFLCKAIFLFESMIFTFSAYPAIFLYGDVGTVLAFVQDNKWDAWHTIGFVWFCEICSWITPAPFSVLVVQTLIWIFLNIYIIETLDSLIPKAVTIYTIIMCGIFTPALYLEYMAKDVVFSIGVLALTVVTFKILRTNKTTIADNIIFATLPLFCVLCRQGGFVPVFVVEILIIVRMFIIKNKKILFQTISVFLFHVLALFVVNVILSSAFNVVQNPACVKYGTPMVAVGAAVNEGVEFSEEDVKTLEKLMPLDQWGECYTPYWADDMSRWWGNLGDNYYEFERLVAEENFGSDLIKINGKLFIQHPIIYSKAIFNMNSILWEFGKPDGALSYNLCLVDKSDEITYTSLYKFTSWITQAIENNPVTRALCTRGGVPTFIIFVTLFVVLIRANKRYEIISLIPIIIIMLMLSITVPAQDTRYILPAIESAVFFLSICLAGGYKKENIESNNE